MTDRTDPAGTDPRPSTPAEEMPTPAVPTPSAGAGIEPQGAEAPATDHGALERQWMALGGPSASKDWTKAGDDLLARYDEAWRGYHNRQHIAEALAALRLLGGGLPEQVAIWFHDAIYGLGPGADERASAELALEVLSALGMPRSVTAQVHRLVLVTEHHSPAPGDMPGAHVSDADMAILAADEPRYDESVRGIRREHLQYDDEQFNAGRIAVLEGFLAAPSIFHTPHGRQHWEQRARANIARELAARHQAM